MIEPAGLEGFVAANQRSLQRAGWLLTGQWAAAEDLAQGALADLGDTTDTTDTRVAVAAVLAGLTPRQRAVLTARFLLDLTEADTAAALGCSVGTVKSHSARAVAALRRDRDLHALIERQVQP